MREVTLAINGRKFTAKLRRKDRNWGHGVDVELTSKDGIHAAHCSFLCHPGFDGFVDCQAKTTEELLEVAKARLEAGAAGEVMISARKSSIRILYRINGSAEPDPGEAKGSR